MDLNFSSEQSALRDALKEFFEKESPPSVVRAAEPVGFDEGLWRKVVGLGLGAVGVPEDQGGHGGGMVELAIAAESYGEHLAPVPLIEAAVTNRLLASIADRSHPDIRSLAARAVTGELLATLAIRPVAGGVAHAVPAGAVADLVVALDGEQLVLVIQPDGSSARPSPVTPNLGAMPLGHCRLGAAETVVLASGPDAVAAYERAVHHWQALTAVALVGLGFRALDIGIEYVMQRRAFGVLIANFQTIQHRLADNVTALDGARLLAYEAAWAADVPLSNAETLATMAFLFASESAFKAASESLHFHGGYGYTLEYDIQLYFRRAKAWALVAGDPRLHYVTLGRRLFEREGD
jgi:alkylation response protein AidB-like acyl-CoA dehydrogenase